MLGSEYRNPNVSVQCILPGLYRHKLIILHTYGNDTGSTVKNEKNIVCYTGVIFDGNYMNGFIIMFNYMIQDVGLQ